MYFIARCTLLMGAISCLCYYKYDAPHLPNTRRTPYCTVGCHAIFSPHSQSILPGAVRCYVYTPFTSEAYHTIPYNTTPFPPCSEITPFKTAPFDFTHRSPQQLVGPNDIMRAEDTSAPRTAVGRIRDRSPMEDESGEDSDAELQEVYVQAYACQVFRDDPGARAVEDGAHLRPLTAPQVKQSCKFSKSFVGVSIYFNVTAKAEKWNFHYPTLKFSQSYIFFQSPPWFSQSRKKEP